MKLQEGVYLHYLPSKQFTTNRIVFRFSAPLQEETVAGRVLVANLLEMGSQEYPSLQELRKKLASLYGANLSTSVSKRGQIHAVDVAISYVKARFLPQNQDLTKDVLELLISILLKPLAEKKGFQKEIFETEKKNLLSYLEAEVEDNFYHADRELDQLFFQESHMSLSRVSRKDLVKEETPVSTYQIYQNMLKLDQIDVFVLGEVEEAIVTDVLSTCAFRFRKPALQIEYRQPISNITKEKMERKVANQSILEMGFALQTLYNDQGYAALLVLNALLGDSPQSRLFVHLREKEGLAYTIGSSVNIHSGLLRVYAGIDRDNRIKTIQLIQAELKKLRVGKIAKEELQMAKKSLFHAYEVSKDQPVSGMEESYQQLFYGSEYKPFDQVIKEVKQVSIDEIQSVARKIQLQALYFMEGTIDNDNTH